MKFLASLIVATIIVVYMFIVSLVVNIVPCWLSPVVVIFALTFFIHVTTTGIGQKR